MAKHNDCPFCQKSQVLTVQYERRPADRYGLNPLVFFVRCEWCWARGPVAKDEETAWKWWDASMPFGQAVELAVVLELIDTLPVDSVPADVSDLLKATFNVSDE